MARRISLLLIVAIAMMAFLYTAQAQTGEKKWKKTITLPNSEKILDISGEWDAFVEDQRPGSPYKSDKGVTKITQTGSSFVGIATTHIHAFRKSTEQIKGDLDKNRFKQIQIESSFFGVSEAKGQVSEDGNKIIVEDGQRFKLTFTRK